MSKARELADLLRKQKEAVPPIKEEPPVEVPKKKTRAKKKVA